MIFPGTSYQGQSSARVQYIALETEVGLLEDELVEVREELKQWLKSI